MQITTETRVGMFVLLALGILFVMSWHIGSFRFGAGNYHDYIVYFKDVSGLAKKADVKIAGVSVGWVNDLTLVDHGEYAVQATVKILKGYQLHSDAHALVRQDGLLGVKYLELVPGDPLKANLAPGTALQRPSLPAISIEDILERVDRIVKNNEENINSIFSDLRDFSHEAKRLSHDLETRVFPSFQASVEKIADVFDRDFDRVATQLSATTESIEEAAVHMRDGFKNMTSITEKIDQGKGLIGQLVNDEQVCKDVRVAVEGVREYFAKLESLGVVVDSHFERMYRPAEYYRFEDSKGYFDVRIHPTEDLFYLFQFVSSQKGAITREVENIVWRDCEERPLFSNELPGADSDEQIVQILRAGFERQYAPEREIVRRYRDSVKIGAQFGKIFNNLALRFGLIEGFAGLGIDYDIPFTNEALRWVTTFEAFDFRGRNRFNDGRVHLKWINRVFVRKNLYFAFGADDFISRTNANAFFGLGIRFDDDDLKYLAGSLGMGSLMSVIAVR